MWNIAQNVEDEFIKTVQECERRMGEGSEVGEIGGSAKAEAENFHVAVQQRNGNKLDAQKFERFRSLVKCDARNRTQLGLTVEDIRERASDNLKSLLVGVNRHRNLLPQIIGTNIIESHNVISVAMGEQDCVEACNVGAQGLLAKIGSCVDDDILAVARKEQGRAQAVVVRVWRSANGTVASERGNAHGRARAEYGDF